MTPVKLIRYRGYLIRIVDNGSDDFQYEWTIGQRGMKTKEYLAEHRFSGAHDHRLIDATSSRSPAVSLRLAKEFVDFLLHKPTKTRRFYWTL